MVAGMTREECITSRNHLEMIRRPEWWTLRTILPLTRWVNGEKEFGFISARRPLIVYMGLMFFRTEQQCAYDCPEAIVADGWEVD
jgi:hypothetical protein